MNISNKEINKLAIMEETLNMRNYKYKLNNQSVVGLVFDQSEMNMSSYIHAVSMVDSITKHIQLISIVCSLIGNILVLLACGLGMNNHFSRRAIYKEISPTNNSKFTKVKGSYGNKYVCSIKIRKVPTSCATAYYVLIQQLAIADLIYSTSEIIRCKTRFSGMQWSYGGFACKLTNLTPTSITVSFFITALIAVERFRSLYYPFKKRMVKKMIVRLVCMLWLLAFLVHSPAFIYATVQDQNGYKECIAEFPIDSLNQLNIITFVCTYIIPLVVTLFCYGGIAHKFVLQKSSGLFQTSHTRSHRKLVTMMSLVLVSFLLTTTPNQAFILWQSRLDLDSDPSTPTTFLALFISSSLVHTHSFLNCLIYTIADKKFRRNLCSVFSLLRQKHSAFWTMHSRARTMTTCEVV